MFSFYSNITEIYSKDSNANYGNIGSNNDLLSDPLMTYNSRIFSALGLAELNIHGALFKSDFMCFIARNFTNA